VRFLQRFIKQEFQCELLHYSSQKNKSTINITRERELKIRKQFKFCLVSSHMISDYSSLPKWVHSIQIQKMLDRVFNISVTFLWKETGQIFQHLLHMHIKTKKSLKMSVKATVFWNVTPYSLVDCYWRLGRICCLSILDRKNTIYTSTLKVVSACSSATSATITRLHAVTFGRQ
jgi:hypothetical protein